MRSFFCALAALTLFAAPAAAQSERPRPFALVNFGFQARSQDFTQFGEFPLYGATATFDAPHSLEGAPFFEIGGGVGIFRNFSVGGSYAWRSTKTRDVQVSASVPSPISLVTFRNATVTETDIEHQEGAFHLQGIWHIPVTVEFEVAVFGGPSFFNAKHDLIDDVTVTEVGGDFSQVNLTVNRSTHSETVVGFNAGVDGRYMFTRNVGAGAMIRFTRGKGDFTAGGQTLEINTGGFEVAGGLRFKF